jgi:hypothetical protein
MEDYTHEQRKKMAEIMYSAREWFDNFVIIIKDNRKPIYFEQDCDDSLVYPMLQDAYYGLCEADDELVEWNEGDDTPEWLEGTEWDEYDDEEEE